MDHVDKILAQWRRERPDLDVAPMGLLGRLARLRVHLLQAMAKNFAAHGLSAANFDVLATLRRSGAPYCLSPGALLDATMVTSGTITARIDQLEKKRLVARCPNPEDGRGALVSLTKEGLALVDEVITAHVAIQRKLIAGLSESQFETLNELLRTFLAEFEKLEDNQ